MYELTPLVSQPKSNPEMLIPTWESVPVARRVVAEHVAEGADEDVAVVDMGVVLVVVGFEVEELDAAPGKHWE